MSQGEGKMSCAGLERVEILSIHNKSWRHREMGISGGRQKGEASPLFLALTGPRWVNQCVFNIFFNRG